jgi:SNF2 family DNA or RNA helicase
MSGQIFHHKTQPLLYQVEAIDYISKHNEVALFDEQGLGKTKIVIDALCNDMKNNVIEGVLVIAPMSLLYNWEQEIEKHSYLIPIVLKGGEREIRYKYLTGANFYITNYESVVVEIDRIKRFCKSRKMAIVLDESARIKNPNTKTAQSIYMLKPFSQKRIIITGTPVANKPVDLWSQFYFLDGGKCLGDNYMLFRSKCNENNDFYEDNLNEIRIRINNCSIRRTKNKVLELPEKLFKNIYVKLASKQQIIYNKLRDDMLVAIKNIDGKFILDNSENILKRLLRLVQVASNPFLFDKGYDETPQKFIEIDNLLEEKTNKGEKAIIWSSFVENIFILKNRYKNFKPLVIHGDVPIVERTLNVRKFQEQDDNKLLIANPSAAREGLTLTRANNAIYLDRSFNLVDYLQSQDRIHRISQTKVCSIYKLIAKKTIDEYVDMVIDFKRDIANFIQGDSNTIKEDSKYFLLNKKQIMDMLGG